MAEVRARERPQLSAEAFGLPAKLVQFLRIANAGQLRSDRLFAPNLRGQGLAALRAWLTLLMFSTPVVLSQSSKALEPCLAKMAMPSFHVAQPQRTPLNLVPDSPASSRVSMKTGLETPAER